MGKKRRKKLKKTKTEPKSNRNTLVVGAIFLVLIGAWGLNQLSGSDYPGIVSGVPYEEPIISAETGQVTVSEESLNANKMLFIDVKLENRTEEFVYMGRRIILSSYRNAEYLPLILIRTPKGETLGGIRVCEPCSSFSFHIVEAKYLSCDACGTRWNIETLQGVSGGCMDFPPPKLTTGLINGVTIEAGLTGLSIQA